MRFESNAQVDTTLKAREKNTIFFEGAGNSVLYSLNYDRLIKTSNIFMTSARIGVHYSNDFNNNNRKIIAIPFELSKLYLFHKTGNFIEFGSGITYINENIVSLNHTVNVLVVALRIGYRLQKPKGGFFFKVGLTPLYDFYAWNRLPKVNYNTLYLSFGLGIGYTFKSNK